MLDHRGFTVLVQCFVVKYVFQYVSNNIIVHMYIIPSCVQYCACTFQTIMIIRTYKIDCVVCIQCLVCAYIVQCCSIQFVCLVWLARPSPTGNLAGPTIVC